MAENNDPPPNADQKPADGSALSQRRTFVTRRNAPPAPADAKPELVEKLAHLVDSVKVLQSHFTPGGTEGEANENEFKARRSKRFQRTGNQDQAENDPEPVLDHEIRGDEATLNKNIAWPRLTRRDLAPPPPQAKPAAFARKHPFIIWAVVQITGFGLLMLGYWFGQSASGDAQPSAEAQKPGTPSAPADELARVGVSDRALDATNLGLRAEKSGNLKGARDTWDAAVSGHVRLPGAEYRLAMLDVANNDLAGADIHLTNSLAAGERMAACYFVNACFAARKGNYIEVAQQLQHAVRVDPFDAKLLFCWGEALRRAGKPQAAIDTIARAMERPTSPADMELFTFKLRLARIQAGHDDAMNAELAANLAKTPLGGDWLLLAVAQDLASSDFPRAAGHLKSAAHALTPDVYNLLLQDFAFQGYANRPEVAQLLKTPPPPVSVGPLDPGAWPSAEADPATWPPFSPAL